MALATESTTPITDESYQEGTTKLLARTGPFVESSPSSLNSLEEEGKVKPKPKPKVSAKAPRATHASLKKVLLLQRPSIGGRGANLLSNVASASRTSGAQESIRRL